MYTLSGIIGSKTSKELASIKIPDTRAPRIAECRVRIAPAYANLLHQPPYAKATAVKRRYGGQGVRS